MAYRMVDITDRVRVGINEAGELNIEVWHQPRHVRDALFDEVMVPADALAKLGAFIIAASHEAAKMSGRSSG